MDYSLRDMLGLAPYDPKTNKPISLPGGEYATEYTATSQLPDGSWVVHPQIWWDAEGNPHWLGEQSLEMALLYEDNTGSVMPRFETENDANKFAATRSSGGGGMQGGIASLFRK